MKVAFWPLAYLCGKSCEEGAQTSLFCCLEPGLNKNCNGEYFSDCKVVVPNPQALELDVAKNLWIKSAQLVGLEDDK